jgi:hypothetical protein
MTRRTMRRSALGMFAASSSLLWLLGSGIGSASPIAHAARTTKISESVDLHLVKKTGGILKEKGTATGTLAGSVSATFNTSNLARVTGTVTFFARGGSVTITALGYPSSLSKFSGPISVKGGTGRFRHAHGSGSCSGNVNHKTWHVTVKAHGSLTY